jgi:hypothetical protein
MLDALTNDRQSFAFFRAVEGALALLVVVSFLYSFLIAQQLLLWFVGVAFLALAVVGVRLVEALFRLVAAAEQVAAAMDRLAESDAAAARSSAVEAESARDG